MLVYPDVLTLLIFSGTYYAVMYGVTASLSVAFEDVYPYLTQADVGLCFVALGGGLSIGSWLSGKLADSYYRKVRDDLIRQAQSTADKHIDAKAFEKDPTFPIEKARLQVLPCIMLVLTGCVVAYGWALKLRVTIAVSLILQFISRFISRSLMHGLRLTAFLVVGLLAMIILNTTQTLLVDLVPNQGSSITACVRTSLPQC
jgi:MFS family permease